VIDLMTALKRSLAQETPATGATTVKDKAGPARTRSAPAVAASTGRRRPKEEGGARDRAGRRRRETAKEGLNAGHDMMQQVLPDRASGHSAF